MGILSALWKLFKAVLSKVFNLVKLLFKKLWPLLLVLALIWFAPAIGAWLTSIGAPNFLISAFSSLSSLTPYLVGAAEWVGGSAVFSAISSGWSAFKALELGTQLAIVAGAAAVIAPEETAELVSETVSTVAGLVSVAVGAVASGFFGSPIGLVLIGGLGIYLLSRKRGAPEEEKDPAFAREKLAALERNNAQARPIEGDLNYGT